MEVITRTVVQSLWGCQHVDWCYMRACGSPGCILIMSIGGSWRRLMIVWEDIQLLVLCATLM